MRSALLTRARRLTARNITTATTWEATVAMPAPTSSRRGKPRNPKMSNALRIVFTAVTATPITIGVRVSLAARKPLS